MIPISAHACQRWIDRIDPRATPAEARAAIAASDHALSVAVDFGCHVVRTPAAKLVLRGGVVSTVVPRSWIVRVPECERVCAGPVVVG